jgi:3-deoxy-manno-octulosonate cytidylyltransferase (CMP-KDO synthetase)
MKIIGIIPARYQSSRFPGKPLVDILGKPMIQHVYDRASQSKLLSTVYIATDDRRIRDVCEKNNMKVVMTSDKHPTGTDRVAEAAEKIDGDIFVNIQGDEPMISPNSIDAAIKGLQDSSPQTVTCLMKKIETTTDLLDTTVPKVVSNDHSFAVFFSRQPIPYPKGSSDVDYYKQVCVYAFTKDALIKFKSLAQSRNELIEEIELLRFIENGIPIKMIEVFEETIAVDVPNDVIKVCNRLRGN